MDLHAMSVCDKEPCNHCNTLLKSDVTCRDQAKKKNCYVALSRPTVKCEKTGSGFFFFFFFFKCQIWAKNLLKFVFNGLKKHLHDLYMRFDCIPPEFSPFRNFKKNIGKLNSLTVRKKKKKKKKKIPTDRPNFQILVGWGQHNNFFFWPHVSVVMDPMNVGSRIVNFIVNFICDGRVFA